MNQHTDLYDTDFFLWTQEQAALLRDGKARDLDWTNLAEEVESLGASEKRTLGSHLQVLLLHLFKWQYQPTHRQDSHSWQDSMEEAREQIGDVLESSPSLRRHLPALLEKHYPRARRKAHRETGLPLATFPAQCPWDVDQVLDATFFPEVQRMDDTGIPSEVAAAFLALKRDYRRMVQDSLSREAIEAEIRTRMQRGMARAGVV